MSYDENFAKKRKFEGEGSGETKRSPAEVKEMLTFWTLEQCVKVLSQMGSASPEVLQAIQSENESDPKLRKLFVRSLSFETTDQTLHEAFNQYGDIIEAVVIMNKATGKSKGFGFVTFATVAAAEAALVNPTVEIDGRSAYVNLAAKKSETAPTSGFGSAVGGAVGGGGIPGDTSLTKLFIRQLDYNTTSETLNEHFKQYGTIKEAVVLTNKETGQSKGFGFITFEDAASASRALVDPSKVIDGRTTFCKLAAAPNTGSLRPQAAQPFGQQQRVIAGYQAPAPAAYGAYPTMNPYAPAGYGQYQQMPPASGMIPQKPAAYSYTQQPQQQQHW